MESATDFELAQSRIATRRRYRQSFFLWLAIFIVLIAGNVIFGSFLGGATILAQGIAFFMAFVNGVRWFYQSPFFVPQETLIKREMVWLFGEDWQDFTDAQEYIFAQDRIRKRRLGRWLFFFHIPLFLFANWLLLGISQMFTQYGTGRPDEIAVKIAFYGVVGLWTVFLIYHAIQAFPTAGMLAKRERKAAEELQHELQNMRPQKVKNEDKLKRHPLYGIGDDGELIELNEDDEKPKRGDS
jgi:hypothetical protein